MAQVKAANATTTTSTTTTASPIKDTPSNGSDSSICSTMPPVTNVTLCEGVEDKNPEMHEHSSLHEEEETEENIEETVGCGITSVVSEEVTSSASSTAPVSSSTGTGGGAPSLILPETDNLSVSSPDSGHGTTSSQSDGQSEHDVVVSQHQPAHHHNHHHQHLLPHHHHHHPMMVGPDGTSGMMTAVLTEPGGPMLPHPMHHHHHYASWMSNGQAHHHPHHRVMEPVAINPETGFTTVLVDASAMAGYPHHHHLSTGVATGAPWPPHHNPYATHHHPHAIPTGHHSHFGSQQQPQPPPHFLHPHAYHHHQTYDGGGGLGPADYGIAYMGGGSGAYDPGPLLSAPTYHHDPTGGMYHDPTGALQHMSGVNNGNCPTSSASQYGTMNKNGGLAGRNNRSARGASVSPKRPTNRSASQNNSSRSTNGQRQQRSSGGQSTVTTSGGGRFTPSPSSGRSRGSSPGQPPLIPSSQASCNNSVGAVPAGPLPPNAPGQHVVHLHVNPGETVSLQMGGQVQVIQGPATVRMVSTGSPPVPLPVQVPPGHVLQQIVDERGTLRHVILSPAPPSTTGPAGSPGSGGSASGQQPSSSAAGTASASVGVLPLPTPMHPPPPPPPPHYGSAHNIGQPPPPATTGATTTATPPLYYGTNGQGGGYTSPHIHHHHPQSHQQGYGPGPNVIQQGHHPRPHPQQPAPHHQHHHPHGFVNVPSANVVHRGPSSPSPPSPPSPPSLNFQSERAQRQFAKLRKKLESRPNSKGVNVTQQHSTISNTTTTSDTPPSSPKKDNNNIRKLKDRNQNGVPEPSTSCGTTVAHAGEDQTDAKDEKELLAERITELKAPQVSDVGSRIATLNWDPVETVIATLTNEVTENASLSSKELDISYEVVLGQKTTKAAGSLEKSCYKGKECTFRFADLQPGTEYWIRLSALVNRIRVRDAPLVDFFTDACPPDSPLAPKLTSRTKNSVVLRWSAPAENGSPLSQYILECGDDTENNEQFSEVFRGRNKQFTVTKLQPSTCYSFRLAACNEIGISEWSELLRVTTRGAPPSPPMPPVLRSISAKQISLVWEEASAEVLYTLQMADPISGHGFLNVYHGPDNEYICTGLTRSTTYRFRLQAQNEDGISRWSDETNFSTVADKPGIPARPSIKGRILAHSFKVRWDPPSDVGGASICQYFLDLDSGNGFVSIWSGSEMELSCDKLQPGTTYRVRVSCSNGQEQSDFSEPLIVTTEPVVPGPSPPPSVLGKAKSTSLQLKWERPDYDGGSMITQYEVNMINPDGSSRIAFSGYETECLVASLLPGRIYSFQVRASNRIGFGPWSELFETKSGPGVPDVPSQPQLVSRSAHSIALSWAEPAINGSAIIDYRLEIAHNLRSSRSSSSVSSLVDTVESQSDLVDFEQLVFSLAHSGSARQHEVKGLHPSTNYFFRIQAVNAVGCSPSSSVASITTLASSPAAVSNLRCIAIDATSLSLSWSAPHSNGSPILYYNVEVGDRGTFCTNDPATSFDALDLTPNTQYRVRVQAANAIGVGPFSSSAKFSTLALPPDAPRLECAQTSYNSLKLRWGDGKNLDFNNYTVEMREENSEKFYLIYEGPSQSYRVSKLKECTNYTFRICARNEVGEGPYSEDVTFATTKAPPPTIKKTDVLDLTETSCRIAWSVNRLPFPVETITYQVEINRAKEQEPILTRRCTDTETSITGLDPRAEYSVRILPIRLCVEGELAGVYSPSKPFSTLLSQTLSNTDSTKRSSNQIMEKNPKPLTDQQWATIIISALIAFSILIAVVMNQLVVT